MQEFFGVSLAQLIAPLETLFAFAAAFVFFVFYLTCKGEASR